VADATTLMGEVTLEPSVGLESVSGKSFEPVGGAVASGAGSLLVLGDQVIGTGGTVGKEGCDGAGVVGAGVGVGVVGVMLFDVPLHPASERLAAINASIPEKKRMFRRTGKIARIRQPPDF